MNAHKQETYTVTIYIAGDIDAIKHYCAHWCYRVGRCVTVTETEFIYTGGRERGAAIGLINYPRFPDSFDNIWSLAEELASLLIRKMAQRSALLQDKSVSVWVERR